MIKNSGKRKERTSKKKKINGVNNVGKSSVKKRKEVKRTIEKNKNTPEIWSKVIGRKERKRNAREEINRKDERDKKKEKVKKKKPFKTSAVVITSGDRNTSYSEVLAWAR